MDRVYIPLANPHYSRLDLPLGRVRKIKRKMEE